MAWRNGASIFSSIIDTISSNVDDEDQRREIYKDLIELFEDHDCTNLEDCYGEDNVFNEVFCEIHPDKDPCRVDSGEDESEDY